MDEVLELVEVLLNPMVTVVEELLSVTNGKLIGLIGFCVKV